MSRKLTFIFGQLLQNFTDNLTDALQGFQVILGFIELFC